VLTSLRSAPQGCHTRIDRRTEKSNKINSEWDCSQSSILSGSTSLSFKKSFKISINRCFYLWPSFSHIGYFDRNRPGKHVSTDTKLAQRFAFCPRGKRALSPASSHGADGSLGRPIASQRPLRGRNRSSRLSKRVAWQNRRQCRPRLRQGLGSRSPEASEPSLLKTQAFTKRVEHEGIRVEPQLLAKIEHCAKSDEGEVWRLFFRGLSEGLLKLARLRGFGCF
jgi:hypothetical protein